MVLIKRPLLVATAVLELTLAPYQRAEANFSAMAGGLDPTPEVDRRLAVAVWSILENLPMVLFGLSGTACTPSYAKPLVRGLGDGIRTLIDVGGSMDDLSTALSPGIVV